MKISSQAESYSTTSIRLNRRGQTCTSPRVQRQASGSTADHDNAWRRNSQANGCTLKVAEVLTLRTTIVAHGNFLKLPVSRAVVSTETKAQDAG